MASRPLALALALLAACSPERIALPDGGGPGEDAAGSAIPADGGATLDAGGPTGAPRVSLALTVHLEGMGWSDETRFARSALVLRERAALFSAHGGRMTLEAAEAIAGSSSWDPTLLGDMIEMGHEVGLHADAGGTTRETFASMETKIGERLDGLVALGIVPATISGISSHLDWIQAAIDADVPIVTGTVAYALMSLPYEDRPPELADCDSASSCHQPWPLALEDRLEPWRTSSSLSWTTHDPDGLVTILPTSGSLVCLNEERGSTTSMTACPWEDADIDAFLETVDAAYAIAVERDRPVYLTFTWSFGNALDAARMTRLLTEIEARAARDEVVWRTAGESVAAWRAGE